MLNPAWQPAQDYAERLLHISHHFLSETTTPAPRAPAIETMRLPVLLSVNTDLPQHQGHDYLLRALARQLNLPIAQPGRIEVGGRNWNLHTYAHASDLPQGNFVMVMIDPTLEATRHAFTLLKQLRQRNIEHVAVIFRAGDDLSAARRCYRRLAVGALRFLDLTLVNLGWLPNPGPHFAASLAHASSIIHSIGHEPAPAKVMQ